jgi:hypothetical protein
MLSETARRRLAALRQPARAARLARVLWTLWAVIVWNVVFDHVIVSAGRQYIAAAHRAVAGGSGAPHFEKIDDWMRPAVSRALVTATVSAAAILAVGLATIHLAARTPHTSQVTSCALRPTR